MKRRALLAAAGGGVAAALAGCVETDSTPGGVGPTPERQTPPASETTFDGTLASELARREVPEPPDAVTPESAREFVRAYERAVLYNDLVEYADKRGEPVQTEVRPIRTDVVADFRNGEDGSPGGGLLVVSDGSARARRDSGGYTVHRALVVHYLADSVHRPRQYTAYQCVPPALGDDAERDPADAASLQVYDFADDDHEVSVAVHEQDGGDRVFFARYDPSDLRLVVQPGVVASAGEYEVSVARQSGALADVAWKPQPETPSWGGLTVVLLPGGRLFAAVLDPDVPASFDGGLCGRAY
ncbi:hypothetical protein [Halobacterium jilantaiense]|uniref:Uncharacterized protein n=1 Tax=Halobacterium jilantaiense TaxID=355548 RepID=A0A1I0NRZ9_9EURY|nr:hypothetical protein [Halobacterium jilantaiense]SEW04265.1 hypothetical protein SAMN04487945_1097 [Halobacterium jilantaiense]